MAEIKTNILDFDKMSKINVNDYIEKKNGLSYLSWANAWQGFCREYPDATYKILKDENGIPAFGNSDIGYMVYVDVTACGTTHQGFLPVMDFRNKAVKSPDMMDVNKALMRALTKALAMFGYGIYIYCGEDLPDEPDTSVTVVSRGGTASSGMERADGIEWLKSQPADVIQMYLDKYNKDKKKSITDPKYMAGDWIKETSAKDNWK
ncbi:MAG: DUF1071 domain-containing protein [Cellulosilyticaceae bacterium]